MTWPLYSLHISDFSNNLLVSYILLLVIQSHGFRAEGIINDVFDILHVTPGPFVPYLIVPCMYIWAIKLIL